MHRHRHNAFITNAVDFVGEHEPRNSIFTKWILLPNIRMRYTWILWSCFSSLREPLNRRRRGEGREGRREGCRYQQIYEAAPETYVIFYDTSRTVGGWQAERNSLEISSCRRLSRVSSMKFARDTFSLHIETVETFVSHDSQYFLSSCHMLLRLILEYRFCGLRYCVK